MMTPDEIARLAALGNALRPSWPSSSLRTFIERHLAHTRAYGDTAVALAWIATKTKTETPRLLLEAGVWWQAALLDGQGAPKLDPYDPARFCHVCGRSSHAGTSDHEFVTATDHARRLAHETPKPPLRELVPTTDPQESA